MNRQSQDVLRKLKELNARHIVASTRAVGVGQPVRWKGHEPRIARKGNGEAPALKVHKGELRPGTWRDLR